MSDDAETAAQPYQIPVSFDAPELDRVQPLSWTGSDGTVQSSWLPGVQMTVPNLLLRTPSAHSMPAGFSAASPATSSQSRGELGRGPSTNRRFSG